MKNVLLLACLLLAAFQSDARSVAPLQPLQVTSANGVTNTVYVRLVWENEYTLGNGRYGDVVLYFYEDALGEIPTALTGLTINLRVSWYDGFNAYINDYSITGSSYSTTVATNVEHDYYDDNYFRYRDYYLLAGDGYAW